MSQIIIKNSRPKFPNAAKLMAAASEKINRHEDTPAESVALETIPHLETPIRFFVEGKPETAGSKRAIPLKNKYTGKCVTTADGRPVINVIDDNPKSSAWKKHVGATAKKHYHDLPISCAVAVSFTFHLLRPEGHFGSGRNSAIMKPSAPAFHTKKPDALKMARAAEDGLTGIIWGDDSQIVTERIEKQYSDQEGVFIEIREVTNEADQKTLFELKW